MQKYGRKLILTKHHREQKKPMKTTREKTTSENFVPPPNPGGESPAKKKQVSHFAKKPVSQPPPPPRGGDGTSTKQWSGPKPVAGVGTYPSSGSNLGEAPGPLSSVESSTGLWVGLKCVSRPGSAEGSLSQRVSVVVGSPHRNSPRKKIISSAASNSAEFGTPQCTIIHRSFISTLRYHTWNNVRWRLANVGLMSRDIGSNSSGTARFGRGHRCGKTDAQRKLSKLDQKARQRNLPASPCASAWVGLSHHWCWHIYDSE